MPTQEEIIKLGSIPVDAVVKIEISGAFYMRLHQTLLNKAAEKSPEEFAKIMKELKLMEPKDVYEHDLGTILSVVLAVENAAKDQNLIKSTDFPIKVDDEVKKP